MVRKILITALIILIIISLRVFPTIYANYRTPEGYVFSGQASWFDPWDINLYVAAIRYGQAGHITLINQYSTTDNGAAFIYPIYTAAGFFIRNIDPYIIFHMMAAITGIVLCVLIFALSYKMLGNFVYSLISMFMITRGGGLGWLFYEKIQSADLYIPSFTFASTLQRSHEGIGTMLRILATIAYFYYLKKDKSIWGIISYLSLFLLIFFYPYYIISFAVIAGLYTVWYCVQKKTIKFLLLLIVNLVVIGVAAFIYYSHLQSGGFAAATAENLNKVGFLPLILGYALFITLFIIIFFTKRTNNLKQEQYYLITWVFVSLVFSYLPFGFSRLYYRGLFFPLVLLSLILIRNISDKIQRRIILIVFLVLMPLSSFFTFYMRVREADTKNSWYYLPQEIDDAFNFLEQRKRDGILSLYTLGNYLPAKTNKTVYFGHLIQTPEAVNKIRDIVNFYSGKYSDEEAKKFLTENKITFVVYGPEEIEIGEHVYPFLKLMFDNKKIKVYAL